MLNMNKNQKDNETLTTPIGAVMINTDIGTPVEIIGVNKDVNGKDIPAEHEFPFCIGQKLKNGNYLILAGEGRILEIKLENLRNIK